MRDHARFACGPSLDSTLTMHAYKSHTISHFLIGTSVAPRAKKLHPSEKWPARGSPQKSNWTQIPTPTLYSARVGSEHAHRATRAALPPRTGHLLSAGVVASSERLGEGGAPRRRRTHSEKWPARGSPSTHNRTDAAPPGPLQHSRWLAMRGCKPYHGWLVLRCW